MFYWLYKLSRKSGLCCFLFNKVYKCDIPKNLNIGKEILFPHKALGVVIHPFSIIGNNVCIQHHVLIGEKNGNECPIIEDNVVLNPYSIIIGNVHIGKNSVIGAGSIVTKDIPENCVYYGKITPIIKKSLQMNVNKLYSKSIFITIG